MSNLAPQMKMVGQYKVYSDGVIISTLGWRGNAQKAIRPYAHTDGYLCMNLTLNGIRRRWRVHKLIAELFLPERPSPSHQIRHLDGNLKNNAATNLAWGTAKENAADRAKHGRTSRGRKHADAVKNGIKNARVKISLIAAAPEMYDLLKRLRRWIVIDETAADCKVTWDEYFAVLAKAKGK